LFNNSPKEIPVRAWKLSRGNMSPEEQTLEPTKENGSRPGQNMENKRANKSDKHVVYFLVPSSWSNMGMQIIKFEYVVPNMEL